jgi:hypothetical protein
MARPTARRGEERKHQRVVRKAFLLLRGQQRARQNAAAPGRSARRTILPMQALLSATASA